MNERNRKGEWCPYCDRICIEGLCSRCSIYEKYQKAYPLFN